MGIVIIQPFKEILFEREAMASNQIKHPKIVAINCFIRYITHEVYIRFALIKGA